MAAKTTPAASSADDAQASKEAELRRRAARVRAVRSKTSVEENLKVLNQDPSKVYEWINIDPRRVAFFEAREYVVCNATNSPKVKTNWVRDDGTHVQGDAILMMVDRELKQDLDADDALRSMDRDRLAPGGLDPETAAWARSNNVAMVPLSGE
jgi:hypothetical protein